MICNFSCILALEASEVSPAAQADARPRTLGRETLVTNFRVETRYVLQDPFINYLSGK